MSVQNFMVADGVLGAVAFNPANVEVIAWNSQEHRIEITFSSGKIIDLVDKFEESDIHYVAKVLKGDVSLLAQKLEEPKRKDLMELVNLLKSESA